MITLTCSRCERKLKVKDEAAGRAVQCPACQQAVKVPDDDLTDGGLAPPATGSIDDATLPPPSPSVDGWRSHSADPTAGFSCHGMPALPAEYQPDVSASTRY